MEAELVELKQEIKDLKGKIERIEGLHERHPDRARLPELDKQRAELERQKAELERQKTLEQEMKFLQAQAAAAAQAGGSLPGAMSMQAGRAAAGQLLGDASEGINARPLRTDRTNTCGELLAMIQTLGFVLLRGPPRSGKTALLQLVGRLANQQRPTTFSRVIYISSLGIPLSMTWEDWFKSQTHEEWSAFTRTSGGGATASLDSNATTSSAYCAESPVLLLIDELQCLYGDRTGRFATLYGYIKRIKQGEHGLRLRMLAAAVFGAAPSYQSSGSINVPTPFEYDPSQLVGLHATSPGKPALALTAAEYDELWFKVWAEDHNQGRLFDGTTTKDAIFHMTAGHVGSVVFVIDALKNNIRETMRLPGFVADTAHGLADACYRDMFRTGEIYTALKSNRAYLSVAELSPSAHVQWQLFQRLLEAEDAVHGGVSVELLSPEEKAVLQELQVSGRVRIFSTARGVEQYSFHTPLHLLYYQDQFLKARVERVEEASAGSFEHFLQACISRLSSERLRTTLSVGVDGRMLERKLQVEFHAAALSVLPHGFNVCPDVGKGFSASGIVDFWVSPVGWAVELLRDGSGLSEHEQRFLPGGKYADMPWAEHAVLDFRNPSKSAWQPRLNPQTYHVAFSSDYTTATIANSSKGTSKAFTLLGCVSLLRTTARAAAGTTHDA